MAQRIRTKAGFRMPAEWEPHAATWLAWPHETTDWPGKFAPIPWVYGEIIRHLSRVEKVRILIANKDAEQKARKVLEKSGAQMAAVEFFHAETDRSWTRDYCPIFVRDSKHQPTLLNWQFNGWAKYANSENDDAVTTKLAAKLKLPPSRVYGVATFYHFFTLKPQGRHTCVVCLGTACYVKGADKIMEAIQEKYRIKSGETTPDNELSLLTARCIGACGIAPAVTFDGHVGPKLTPEAALEKLKTLI